MKRRYSYWEEKDIGVNKGIVIINPPPAPCSLSWATSGSAGSGIRVGQEEKL